MRFWTTLGRNSSHRIPAASCTAQKPQKQPETQPEQIDNPEDINTYLLSVGIALIGATGTAAAAKTLPTR